MEETAQLLRHLVATLAYRTSKALRDAPEDFGTYRANEGVRTPNELLRHMTHVLRFAAAHLRNPDTPALEEPRLLPTLQDEIVRFHATLAELSGEVMRDGLTAEAAEKLLQGPMSDALTHAGQISMLRRLAGAPISPESFVEAKVSPDNVSPEQAEPSRPMRWMTAEEEAERFGPQGG